MPEFDSVKNFERQQNGLVPVKAETWEKFVFVNMGSPGCSAQQFSRWLGQTRGAARREQAALLRQPDLRHPLQLESIRR